MEGVAMKATSAWTAPLAALLLAASSASAQYMAPVSKRPLGYAPDAFGPGFYVVCPDGQTVGPNYCLYPPFPPYNGVRPMIVPIRKQAPGKPPTWQFRTYAPQQQMPQQMPQLPKMDMLALPGQMANQDVYPYHPLVRSPRDFFMFRENMEEQARAMRPNLVP
jgi:hypothetical protein